MLVLQRDCRVGKNVVNIFIGGEEIMVKVLNIYSKGNGNYALSLGFEADPSIKILRGELE